MRKKTILVLAPKDPYFIAIQAELLRQLCERLPEYNVIVIPVWGIRFSFQKKAESTLSTLRSAYSLAAYYREQFFLTRDIKRLFKDAGLWELPANARILDIYKHRIGSLPSFSLAREVKRFQDELESYSVGEIQVGDLVIDTFLRFRPSPSLDASDRFMRHLIVRAQHYNSFFKGLFEQYDVTAVAGSYTTYIQHGIPMRLAQRYGADAITFGGLSSFWRRNEPTCFLSHSSDHTIYSPLSGAADKSSLNRARDSLERRLLGQADVTIPYMTSFSDISTVGASLQGKVVVFLHDFFDSPHIYRWMIHHDFYHWITHTLDVLSAHDIEAFVKPHPNQSQDSAKIVKQLASSYISNRNIHWLDSRVTNNAILSQTPLLVISVYGSVIAEAAYRGVRVLSAGDHPGINFDLSYNPKNLKDYEQRLVHPKSIPIPNSEHAVSFMAQHTPAFSDGHVPSLLQFLNGQGLKAEPQTLSSPSVVSFVSSSINKLLSSLSQGVHSDV